MMTTVINPTMLATLATMMNTKMTVPTIMMTVTTVGLMNTAVTLMFHSENRTVLHGASQWQCDGVTAPPEPETRGSDVEMQ